MDLTTWTPRPRPRPDNLSGDRVVLERLDWERHGAGLAAIACGPVAAPDWRYMPIGPFSDLTEFQRGFSEASEAGGWETLVFRIRARDDAAIAGMASYMRIREAHGSAEAGAVLFGPALKRSSAATEAMCLMAAHLFDDLGYRRYEWKCHNDNGASKRAAERLGFRFEGVFRNDMVMKGENRDTAWFAMTDGDWPLIRSGFATWLAAANFDAQGLQRRSLEACRRDAA